MKLLVFFCILFYPSVLLADPFDEAVSAFERGDFASAESTLRNLLKTTPSNASALGLLGAVLDGEKRYPEAEEMYRRAIKLSPRSATLLNNYANHQLTTGDKAGARESYLRVVAVDPGRANANLQLAQFAVDNKDGTAALRYLGHLAAELRSEPLVQILQLQALYLAKRSEEAGALVTRMKSSSDPRLSFSAGLGLASLGRYTEAERFFSRALELTPGNFDALYNLGLAAYHAGHLDVACNALEAALQQRPQDVDVLFNLAAVDIDNKRQETALRLLSEAENLDPSRANVQLALAQTASALGYYADAKLAYERYLKLNPGDRNADREHLFTVALSEQPREGLLALKSFTQAHPKDAAAHYEVGVLEAKSDPGDAAEQFATALTLQPGYTPARLGRGTLNYLQGKPANALADLQFAAARYPENAAVLDRLGEVYNALNRPVEAVSVLTRASTVAPRDSRILMHLSRAQAKAGDAESAKTTLARFRALGPQPGNLIPQAGVVDFLALPPEQQQARYSEAVQRRVQEHPENPDLNMRYLEVLVSEGRTSEVASVVQRLLDSHPPVPIAVEAGEALSAGEQYGAAKSLLEYASGQAPNDIAIQLDLTIVDLHTAGSVAALARLDKVRPQASQTGDVLLARGVALEAGGYHSEASAAFAQAANAKAENAALYQEAVLLLLRNGHQEEAIRLVHLAEESMPSGSRIDMLRASLGF